MKKIFPIVKAIFTVFIFVFLVFSVLTLITSRWGVLGGVRSFVVLSGSMEPTLPVGSIIFTTRQSQYKINDVVAVQSGNVTVTHRIVGQESEGWRLKGDANKEPDGKIVTNDQIVGREFLAIPYLGRLAVALKTPVGFALAVVFPAFYLITMEIFVIKKEWEKEIEKKLREKLNVPVGVVTMIATLLFSSVGVTYSLFSDTATSTTNTFTASNIFPGAAGSVVINEINWVGSNGDGLDEWVELRNMTGSPINLSSWVVDNLGTGSGPGANITIPSGTIPANGFFLIAQQSKASSKINVDPDFITSSVSLSNGGEQLILRSSAGGTIIDTANGTGGWYEGDNSTPKKTMERKNPPSDGTVAGNWQTATTHTGMDGSGPTDEFGTPKNPNGL